MKNHYDIILVGAGLFNAVLAQHFIKEGKSVLVIEKRDHVAGNCFTKKIEGIDCHVYGPHVFHTSDERIWNFINRFGRFETFQLNTTAYYKGRVYNLPFNMNTFAQLFGVTTPGDAKKRILREAEAEHVENPENLEAQAINLVGRTVYETLIRGYTLKQWQRDPKELPPEIIKRLPVRFTYNNNYFNDKYQGIPAEGYTEIIARMFDGADILLGTDYLKDKKRWEDMGSHVFYSGCIDEYYDYIYGQLEYRSVRFETEILDTDNYQGNAVVNYTSTDEPYTRIIEHKWFTGVDTKKSVISREYSSEWKRGDVPYYPVNNVKNNSLYEKYRNIKNDKVTFTGRLGNYKYYDMDDTIAAAFELIEKTELSS